MATRRFMLVLAIAAGAVQAMTALAAPETRTQCVDVETPTGWMWIKVGFSAACPGPANSPNQVVAEHLARDPVDHEVDVCPSPTPAPTDWVATRVIPNSPNCALSPNPFSAQDDAYHLVRLGPASKYVQTNIDACSLLKGPTGWVVVAKRADAGCEIPSVPPGPDNRFAHTLVFADKYRKKGDTIWVCSDQVEPAGWAVKPAQDTAPDPCNGGGRKLIERLADAPTKPAPPTNLNAQ